MCLLFEILTPIFSNQKAPLSPADSFNQTVKTSEFEISFKLEKELESMRITFDGIGYAHEDHSAPLRGEKGTPIKIKYDVLVKTDGVPYHYEKATRYELPTRMTGIIQIGDRVVNFNGAGQRDHSWADRDWWKFEWMWSDYHLSDGTHLHAVKLPGFPPDQLAGEGYIQKDGKLEQMTHCESYYEKDENGLIKNARVKIEPGGIDIEVVIQAFSPVLFKNDDGKASEFTRSWAKFKLKDGRHGKGFIEWHQLRSDPTDAPSLSMGVDGN